MAVQLILNGTEVVVDDTQEIKITKENPFATQSDSYTLDVTIPLTIPQNSRFFRSMQRIDTSKVYQEYTAKLLYGNNEIMEGTAHIVQSTNSVVKVQIANGVSALKMTSEEEGLYIDELDLGGTGRNPTPRPADMVLTNGIVLHLITVLDSEADKPRNVYCPSLLTLAKTIVEQLGYSLDTTLIPEPCDKVYAIVPVGYRFSKVTERLPHWTVKEFLAQIQAFFGCALVRNNNRTLVLTPLAELTARQPKEMEIVDEFTAEYSEEENDIEIFKNIEYELRESDTEIVDKDKLEKAEHDVIYLSEEAMEQAFSQDSNNVRMHKIYRQSGRIFIGWEEDGVYSLKQVATFNPLIRREAGESFSLKISPAYMQEWGGNLATTQQEHIAPARYIPVVDYIKDNEEEVPTMQELVEGSEAQAKEKPDIMSVTFYEGNNESFSYYWQPGHRIYTYYYYLTFTDYSFKKLSTVTRSRWSLSLNALSGYEFYLGQMHQLPFSVKQSVKHTVKFIAPGESPSAIPEATDIFLINGKRFVCEKIEASIRNGHLDRLMTAYLYEVEQEVNTSE